MKEDLRFAFRVLRKQPLFSAAAILTLVIGIGVNSAVFSVFDAVVFQPLPFAEPDRLVRIWSTNDGQGKDRVGMSPADFVDLSSETTRFEGLAAWHHASRTLMAGQLTEEIPVAVVSPDFFEVFGGGFLAGGGFAALVARQDVVVLGEDLANRLFGGAAEAIGALVRLEGGAFEVVGVAPTELTGLIGDVQLFEPLELVPGQHRFRRQLGVIGRLAEDVTLAGAHGELDALAANLEQAHPRSNTGWRTSVVPLRDQILGETGRHLALLVLAGGFLLLITCGNVAALLFARSIGRRREMAVRHALGASRLAIMRQVLIEGQVLTWIAGGLAILVGNWALKLLLHLEPGNLPRLEEIGLDARVVFFTFGVAVMTGLLFGVIVSLRSIAREELRQSGGQPSRGVHRRLSSLMVAEVAAAMVLLLGALVLLRGFDQLRRVDPGFEADGVLAAWIALDRDRYPEDEDKTQYFERLLMEVRSLPEVHSAGLVTALPFSPVGIDFDVEYQIVGQTRATEVEPQALMRVVSPGYFETLETPWVAGRSFTDRDRGEAQKVVIVNEAFAGREWPGGDPLGQQIQLFGGAHTVVGVAANTRSYGLDAAVREELFVPRSQVSWYPSMHLVARTSVEPTAAAPAVRRKILEIDPAQPPSTLTTMGQLLSDSLGRDRFLTILVGLMGLIAVLQAAAGIFGTMSYGVLQRRQEISVRMALGARRSQLLAWVLGRGLVLGVVGIVLGLGVGWGLRASIRGVVYGVESFDGPSVLLAALAMGAVICLASLWPAFRATRVQPMNALRGD